MISGRLPFQGAAPDYSQVRMGLFVAFLVIEIASISPLLAQCATADVQVIQGAFSRSVRKVLTGYPICSHQANMNVTGCYTWNQFRPMSIVAPGCPSGYCCAFTAVAVGNPPSPGVDRSCSFACTGGCGPYQITNADGLPVELMGFEIVNGEGIEPDEAQRSQNQAATPGAELVLPVQVTLSSKHLSLDEGRR